MGRNACLKALCGLLLLLFLVPAARGQEATLLLQRGVSRRTVQAGDPVTLVYHLKNCGKSAATDIAITDPICGAVGSIEMLQPGEECFFSVSVAIDNPCSTAPTLQWVQEGHADSLSLEPVKIQPLEDALRFLVESCDGTEGGPCLLRGTLQNTGASPLRNFRFVEETLGQIGSCAGQVAPGEAMEILLSCRADALEELRISVYGENLYGDQISFQAAPCPVRLTSEEAAPDLTLKAEETEDGRIRLILRNEGAALTQVLLTRETGEKVRLLQAVQPGETILYTENAGERAYLAQFSTGEDSHFTIFSNRLENAPVSNASPEKDALLSLSGPFWQPKDSLYPMLMISSFALIGLILFLSALRLLSRRRQKRLQREKRLRHMRLLRKHARMDEAEWVRTRSHRPVAAANENHSQE